MTRFPALPAAPERAGSVQNLAQVASGTANGSGSLRHSGPLEMRGKVSGASCHGGHLGTNPLETFPDPNIEPIDRARHPRVKRGGHDSPHLPNRPRGSERAKPRVGSPDTWGNSAGGRGPIRLRRNYRCRFRIARRVRLL
jgi:hypothetical protein